MMKKLYVLFGLTIIILSCSDRSHNRETYNRLSIVDSLLTKELPDSALKELAAIGHPEENDIKNKAYYNLLVTQTRYLSYLDADSSADINYAIKYYEEKGDREKLARALHWKAGQLQEAGRYLEAIEAEKGAEKNVDTRNNPMLGMRIYNMMSWLNEKTGNYSLAKDYAFKTLRQATKTGNKERIANAYYSIASEYEKLEQTDSALYYIKKAIILIDHVTHLKNEIIYFTALCYRNNGQWDNTEKYVKEIKEWGTPKYKDLLGDIYIHTGRTDEGLKILYDVLPELDETMKWQTMQIIEDVMMKRGQHEEAARLQEQITLIKDSLARQKQTKEAMEIQKEYDKKIIEEDKENEREWIYIIIGVGCTVAIVGLIVGYCLYLKKQKQHDWEMTEAQLELTEVRQEMKKAQQEIIETRQKYSEAKNTTDALNRKMETDRKEMLRAIAHGKELDEMIDRKEETVLFKTAQDYVDFVEYYQSLNLLALSQNEKLYRKYTTPYHLSIFIFKNIKKLDDKYICCICNVSAGALRTMRSRIKKELT